MAIRVQENVPLRDLTTFKIGGMARYFVAVSSVAELAEAVAFARQKKLPLVVLGGGSNTLIAESEINAVVMKNEIRRVEWAPPLVPPLKRGEGKGGGALITALAGESWDCLVAEAVKRGLWGVENLSGIPGTVGAAPIQNIGAYGTELKDTLQWVEAFDAKTGKLRTLSNKACMFGYRDSVFKKPEGKNLIITRVALRLTKNGVPNLEYKDLRERFKIYDLGFMKGENSSRALSEKGSVLSLRKGELPTLDAIRRAVLEIRSKKFPDLRKCGTAGSFFKNPIVSKKKFYELKKRFPDLLGFPILTRSDLGSEKRSDLVKISLAWVLDNICNLKGYAKGAVRLFEKQPIVLVQSGSASFEEIEAFAKEIAGRVREKTGIEVEWEVQKIV